MSPLLPLRRHGPSQIFATLWCQAFYSSYRQLGSGEYAARPEQIAELFTNHRFKDAEVNGDGVSYHWHRLSRGASKKKDGMVKSKTWERKLRALRASSDSDDEIEALETMESKNQKPGSPSRFGYTKLGA